MCREAQGHRYTSVTDTEMLLHLDEEEGEAMLDQLRGMFALGVPLTQWLKHELHFRLDARADLNKAVAACTDSRGVRAIVNEHVRGRRDRQPLLWKLAVLDVRLDRRVARHVA
jgi:hypothetical protein